MASLAKNLQHKRALIAHCNCTDAQCVNQASRFTHTIKPVLSGHLKTEETKVLMENGSLMTVKSIER